MRVVHERGRLARRAVADPRRGAASAFGNPEVYIEKFLLHPRHVEIQVLADSHGNAAVAGQPRLLVAAAPPEGAGGSAGTRHPGRADRRRSAERCAEACRQIGYCGVGTFEFLYENGAFFFIEMNTRLQVEHPVTEMTLGHRHRAAADPRRAWRAAGRSTQADVVLPRPCDRVPHQRRGSDTASRPRPGASPSGVLPGGYGVRVDSHAGAGYRVPPYYDSMVAKLIVHGGDARRRAGAHARGPGRDAGRRHRDQPAAAPRDRARDTASPPVASTSTTSSAGWRKECA